MKDNTTATVSGTDGVYRVGALGVLAWQDSTRISDYKLMLTIHLNKFGIETYRAYSLRSRSSPTGRWKRLFTVPGESFAREYLSSWGVHNVEQLQIKTRRLGQNA